MKKLLSCLLVLVLLLGTTAFAAEQEPVTLHMVWWGGQARADATKLIVDDFMAKNPGIKIEIEFTDWNGYWSKLSTQVAGGLMPDIVQMNIDYLPMYGEKGLLADLRPFVDDGTIDITNIGESNISSGLVNGMLCGIPTGVNSFGTIYRKDITDAAGVEIPYAPTIDDLKAAYKEVYEKTGRHANVPRDFQMLRFALRADGKQLYNDEGTALGFDDPKYLVDIWQGILDSYTYGYGLRPGEETSQSAFAIFAEDTWIEYTWSNQVGEYANGSDCELTLCAPVVQTNGSHDEYYLQPAMFWAVAETSEHKAEAAAFINYFANDTACYDIVGIDRGMPISSVVRDYLAPNFNKTSQEISALLTYMAQDGHSSPIMKPDIAAHSEVAELYKEYFEAVKYETVDDLTAFANQFIEEANAIIARSLAQ